MLKNTVHYRVMYIGFVVVHVGKTLWYVRP